MQNAANEDIRSWCNPLKPSFGEAMQREKLTGEIYAASKRSDQRASMIRSVRPGSIVEVVELFLLAKTEGRTDVRRRDLVAAVDAIEAVGGRIRELNTGDMTPENKSRMLMRAYETIGASGRGRRSAINGALSKGRPPKLYAPEQMKAMEQIWHSRRYETRKAAREAILAAGIKVTTGYLYHRFGVPGAGREPVEADLGKEPKKPRSWVYFIKDGDRVKIGFSVHPQKRMTDIQTHTPLELLAIVPGGMERERHLHRKFRAHKIASAREWFRLVPEIEKYIARYGRKEPTP